MNITRPVLSEFKAPQTKTSSLTSVSDAKPVSQSVRIESRRSCILMESNFNVKPLFRVSDRRSLSSHDEQLLKILSSQPDEPLVFDDNEWKRKYCNGSEKLLSKNNNQTSSKFGDDYENLPPPSPQLPSTSSTIPSLPVDRVLAVTEELNFGMTSTPPKHINPAFMSQIKRDLNSPSANARLRALRALKSPTSGNYYNFDIPYEEQEIVTDEERNLQPKTIQEVMNDVIVYVEVRTENDNRTAGIKEKLIEIGAKVNDRLLRNTTHVVFKDGKNSTYEKAKSLNIPIVSVSWIEACRKHLCLMDPKGFPITELDRYENPLIYGKMKRHKSMQPGSEDKILNRKVPKSKLLECTKLSDSPILSNLFATPVRTKSKIDATVKTTPISSQRKPISGNKRTIIKSTDKPVNTIRSMFVRQLERNHSQNGTSRDQLNDKTESNVNETEIDRNETKLNLNVQLTPGKLHSRLTRRNSTNATVISDKTAHEEKAMDLTKIRTPNKNHRRSLFPSAISQTTIQEENNSDTNNTITEAIAMEETLKSSVETKTNNDSIKTPSKTVNKLPDGIDVKRSNSAKKAPITKSVLKRRTLYTPQAMDETTIASTSQTSNNRRRTLNFNVFPVASAPNTNIQPDDVLDTVSCDADINKKYDFSNGMPKLETNSSPFYKNLTDKMENKRKNTSKTLLEEYSTSFHSNRSIVSANRRTISDISMDIIRQRMDNINKIASLNRSINESNNQNTNFNPSDDDSDETKDENIVIVPVDGAKPLKRKLFAPPSLFAPVPDIPAENKSMKKRGRDDFKSDTKNRNSIGKKSKATNECTTPANKNGKSRRSTMLFQSIEKPKNKKEIITVCNNNSDTSKSVMVFTNMHQKQIEVIKETVKKLGKFTIENNVNKGTTHVVSLESRRTVNLLRGMARGLWIIGFDWIVKSLEANEWLPEESFEMNEFSRMIKICRIERQVFGKGYRMDIFSDTGLVYVSKKCMCKSLTDLIKLCHGKITSQKDDAKYIIDECSDKKEKSISLTMYWILDSITKGQKILDYRPYLIN